MYSSGRAQHDSVTSMTTRLQDRSQNKKQHSPDVAAQPETILSLPPATCSATPRSHNPLRLLCLLLLPLQVPLQACPPW